ncbi:MAG TPA: PepSY domain-containing protein [Planctomycetota bacterium]|nr:PepSY domain-containing protein [Planctomycetota bacterium]
MPFKAAAIHRRLHRIAAVVAAAPLLVVVATGLLLQLKKQIPWIQPPTQRGAEGPPQVGFDALLAAARAAPGAGVSGWADVDRIDVRPALGTAKMQIRGRTEVQVDLVTGAVLQVATRRSDLIEALHDGSYFHESARLGVFLPAGVLLLVLHVTGLYLWWLPHGVRRRREGRRAVTNPEP